MVGREAMGLIETNPVADARVARVRGLSVHACCTHIWTHACAHTYTHVCLHIFTHLCTHLCTHGQHALMNNSVHVPISILWPHAWLCTCLCTCLYRCIYACPYICLYTRLTMHKPVGMYRQTRRHVVRKSSGRRVRASSASIARSSARSVACNSEQLVGVPRPYGCARMQPRTWACAPYDEDAHPRRAI